ncbi:MAG: DUF397 domain-containing protein [Patescibacteria group bacterium]
MRDSSLFKDAEFLTPAKCRPCNPPGTGLDCVEVAINEHGVAVRSTHDPEKTTVLFSHMEWRNFIGAVRDGSFSV